MWRARVIPCLLLKNRRLVKTVQFGSPTYLGDPINAVRIFNDKEVDELILVDITATIEKRKPLTKQISEIASECFMPLCYGGGIRSIEDVTEILALGVEKVSINSYAVENPAFIEMAASRFGSQSIVVSIDVRKKRFGRYEVFTESGRKGTGRDPIALAKEMESSGAGEILLNSIDQDGTMQGYDLPLIKSVSEAVRIPVIGCGGAGSVADLAAAIEIGKASAASAGSLFVFQGKHRAVLINFPTPFSLTEAFHTKD